MKTVALRRLSTVPIATGLGLPGNNFDKSDPRYIRTTDIATPLTLKDDTFVSQPSNVAARAPVEYGDLLLVSAGASIGKSCLYLSHDPACYAGFLTRIRPESVHAGLFLSYWTQSAHFVDQVRSAAVQATIENFSASRYKDLRVPVVPDTQQKRIVHFLDVETAKIDHLIAKQQDMIELTRQRLQVWRELSFWGNAVNDPFIDPRRIGSSDVTDTCSSMWIGVAIPAWKNFCPSATSPG